MSKKAYLMREALIALFIVPLVTCVVVWGYGAFCGEPVLVLPEVKPDADAITVASFQGSPYNRIDIGPESTIETIHWTSRCGVTAVISWDGDKVVVKEEK